MDTKDLIKYGLIGAAAYYVYTRFGATLGLPSLLPSGSTPQASSTATAQTPTSMIDLRSMMLNKAQLTPAQVPTALMNVSQWNWYYNAVRHTEAPPFQFPSGVNTDTYSMSIDEYLKGTGLGSIQRYQYRRDYMRMPVPLGSKGRIAHG